MIPNIRANKVASWIFAVLMGLFFRYAYGIAKNLLWNRNLEFLTFSGLMSRSQIILSTIMLNFVVALTSSLIAAIICTALLIYVLQKRALFFSTASIATFLALNSRLWHFWEAPDLSMQISILMGPLLAGLVLALTVWLILKILKKLKVSGFG